MLHEAIIGGESGVGAEVRGSDNALNSPMGDDGDPRPMFHWLTGRLIGKLCSVGDVTILRISLI
jgi:hypothetical protein